jgi:hypothetical protein
MTWNSLNKLTYTKRPEGFLVLLSSRPTLTHCGARVGAMRSSSDKLAAQL